MNGFISITHSSMFCRPIALRQPPTFFRHMLPMAKWRAIPLYATFAHFCIKWQLAELHCDQSAVDAYKLKSLNKNNEPTTEWNGRKNDIWTVGTGTDTVWKNSLHTRKRRLRLMAKWSMRVAGTKTTSDIGSNRNVNIIMKRRRRRRRKKRPPIISQRY